MSECRSSLEGIGQYRFDWSLLRHEPFSEEDCFWRDRTKAVLAERRAAVTWCRMLAKKNLSAMCLSLFFVSASLVCVACSLRKCVPLYNCKGNFRRSDAFGLKDKLVSTGDLVLIKFCRLINVRLGDGPTRQRTIRTSDSRAHVPAYLRSSFHWIRTVVSS